MDDPLSLDFDSVRISSGGVSNDKRASARGCMVTRGYKGLPDVIVLMSPRIQLLDCVGMEISL